MTVLEALNLATPLSDTYNSVSDKWNADEVAKKVDFSGKSGIIELDLQFLHKFPKKNSQSTH